MAGALNFLLIASLMQGALCGVFKVVFPNSIEGLSGSCVTIPCSFDVADEDESNLKTCAALWNNDQRIIVFDSRNPQTSTINGDLTKKDCTTTLNNLQPARSVTYSFRVECNKLKYSFNRKISISVKDDPPRPTLTPSALKVEEGTSVNLTCSAPAPCPSHPLNLTWTKGLGDGVETLQENQDKTKVKTSVVTFTASQKHHGETISCTAIYNKQDGSTASAVSESLTADISFAPQILSSSNCIQTADQLNCSCRTEGNPLPTILWNLDGLPVNHTDKFLISTQRLNDTGLWSIITVNGPRERDLSTLLCRSSNSLGSATQPFGSQTSCQDCSGRSTLPLFIVTVGVLTAVLICALLFAIRAQRTGCLNSTKSQCTGDTSTAVISQGLPGEKGNKASISTEEDIYVNTNMIRKSNMPNTHLGHQQVASKSSEKKNEEGSDVVYSSVIWKSKSKTQKRERSGGRNLSSPSYLEEERCSEEGMFRNYVSNALEMESIYDNIVTGKHAKTTEYTEYAQVHFREQNIMHK